LENLNRVKTGPNPFIIGDQLNNFFTFRNLTRNSIIKILTINGHLVRTLEGGFGNEILGSFGQWDGRNQMNRLVSSGVYVYLVMDEEGNTQRGKILVIRK
jgi:flagellar hook assembly protein FlgD